MSDNQQGMDSSELAGTFATQTNGAGTQAINFSMVGASVPRSMAVIKSAEMELGPLALNSIPFLAAVKFSGSGWEFLLRRILTPPYGFWYRYMVLPGV